MIRTVTTFALFSVLTMAFAGCSMAGAGVAQVGIAPNASNAHESTYNSDWVTKDPSVLHELDGQQHMGIDISNHKLGIRNRAGNLEDGADPHVPAWKQRQNARKAARQAEWRAKGGITNIREEQRLREANE